MAAKQRETLTVQALDGPVGGKVCGHMRWKRVMEERRHCFGREACWCEYYGLGLVCSLGISQGTMASELYQQILQDNVRVSTCKLKNERGVRLWMTPGAEQLSHFGEAKSSPACSTKGSAAWLQSSSSCRPDQNINKLDGKQLFSAPLSDVGPTSSWDCWPVLGHFGQYTCVHTDCGGV